MSKAFVLIDTTNQWTVRVPEGKTVVVGRNPAADANIQDVTISRRHAQLQYLGNRCTIESWGLNGVRINGVRISTGEPREVAAGDLVSVAGVTFTVHLEVSAR